MPAQRGQLFATEIAGVDGTLAPRLATKQP
jgi:hypothetical protein